MALSSIWLAAACVLVSCVFQVSGQACASCPGCTSLAVSPGRSLELLPSYPSLCSTSPANQAEVGITVSSSDSGFNSDNWKVLVSSGSRLVNVIAAQGSGQSGYCYNMIPFLSPDNGFVDFSFHCQNSYENCDISYIGYSVVCAQRGSAQSYMCNSGTCNAGDSQFFYSSSVSAMPFCYCEPATTSASTAVGGGSATPTTSYAWVMTSEGSCSTTCGTGTRAAIYTCEDQTGTTVASSFCSGSSPPSNTTLCTATEGCAPTSTSSPSWPGTYNVNPGCSLTSCCCLTRSIAISQSGSNLVLHGAVTGKCGAITTATIVAPYPSGYVFTTAQTSTEDSQTITLSEDGSHITAVDNSNGQCSGSATRSSSSNAAAASSVPLSGLVFFSAALAAALMGHSM